MYLFGIVLLLLAGCTHPAEDTIPLTNNPVLTGEQKEPADVTWWQQTIYDTAASWAEES